MALDIDTSHESGDCYIPGTISIEQSDESESYDNLHIQGKGDVIVSPNIVENTPSNEVDIQFYVPKITDKISITLEGGEKSRSEGEIHFGELKRFVLALPLLNEAEYDSDQFRREATQLQSDQGEVWTIINFVNYLADYISRERALSSQSMSSSWVWCSCTSKNCSERR